VPKNALGHWGKQWQPGTTEDTVSYTHFKINKSSCSPTPEQSFLFNLWISCEQIQDSIYDQSSPQYQFLEILNPLIFETWVKSGKTENGKSGKIENIPPFPEADLMPDINFLESFYGQHASKQQDNGPVFLADLQKKQREEEQRGA
jgi:hypothetical protein